MLFFSVLIFQHPTKSQNESNSISHLILTSTANTAQNEQKSQSCKTQLSVFELMKDHSWILNFVKGHTNIGVYCVIGDRIGSQPLIRSPIRSPITLWVWPIYWATGRLIAMRPKDWMTATLYHACLIFHHRLITRRRPSSGDQSTWLSII